MSYVKSKLTTIKIEKFVIILPFYQKVPSHDLHNKK
jgi:hypothetical protein